MEAPRSRLECHHIIRKAWWNISLIAIAFRGDAESPTKNIIKSQFWNGRRKYFPVWSDRELILLPLKTCQALHLIRLSKHSPRDSGSKYIRAGAPPLNKCKPFIQSRYTGPARPDLRPGEQLLMRGWASLCRSFTKRIPMRCYRMTGNPPTILKSQFSEPNETLNTLTARQPPHMWPLLVRNVLMRNSSCCM